MDIPFDEIIVIDIHLMQRSKDPKTAREIVFVIDDAIIPPPPYLSTHVTYILRSVVLMRRESYFSPPFFQTNFDPFTYRSYNFKKWIHLTCTTSGKSINQPPALKSKKIARFVHLSVENEMKLFIFLRRFRLRC